MKISQLIKTLKNAQKQFGDVDVNLMNSETGDYLPVKSVQKLHPFTTKYGCMNRNEPVNGIFINSCFHKDSDLNIS